jgi:phospholipid/cholesterol/gamma-HCH transport system substrate-binding protein
MAIPRARAIGVGVFVIGGVLLFSVGLFLIGDRRMFFNKTFEVRSEFSRIAGLQTGAKVRVAGLDAGEVTAIHVPTGPGRKFVIAMKLRENVRPIVRTDSVASIQNDGLVGNKFVQIEAGTDAAPVVAEKGSIRGEEPFDLSDLLQKMSETIDVANDTIATVRTELEETLMSVTDTARSAQTVVRDVSADVRAIAASGQKVTSDVSTIVANLKAGRGSVGKLLTDDTLYRQVRDISEQAQKAVANLREASEKARDAVADFRGEGGPMKGLTGDLSQTLEYARDAMQDLAENTEALKHNFFFRGYFNKRGYFDLSDVSVEQYRAGVLEQAGRVPLRIWLQASVLFTRDATGKEILTDAGRGRIGSAVSMFVRYPKDSPLVIEGYAPDPAADQQFLLSRSRATLVRDYVVSRFGLDPGMVTVMPMGKGAAGSPSGDTWDGIAVTLFVAKTAFVESKPVAQGLIDER